MKFIKMISMSILPFQMEQSKKRGPKIVTVPLNALFKIFWDIYIVIALHKWRKMLCKISDTFT